MIFDLEDGDDMFLRNVASHTHCTALYPRWEHSSESLRSYVVNVYPETVIPVFSLEGSPDR
jgi:hypothetical protein